VEVAFTNGKFHRLKSEPPKKLLYIAGRRGGKIIAEFVSTGG